MPPLQRPPPCPTLSSPRIVSALFLTPQISSAYCCMLCSQCLLRSVHLPLGFAVRFAWCGFLPWGSSVSLSQRPFVVSAPLSVSECVHVTGTCLNEIRTVLHQNSLSLAISKASFHHICDSVLKLRSRLSLSFVRR